MSELDSDLRKCLSNFQKICAQSNDNERNNKESNSMLQHLQQVNGNLKENDKKSAEQIKTLRQICNQQVITITELYDFKKRNKILNEENASLQTIVQTLKDEMEAILIKNKVEIDNKENQFNKREKNLQEKIEALQASFDLEIYEKDNEMKNLKIYYDEQLKTTYDKEQHLKDELYKMNTQLTTSTAVLQKKILELEQKLKTSEREKSMFALNQGNNFISANNVFKNYANVNQITCNPNDNTSVNQSQTRNSIIRNVSQNIESNTAKKFQFRKSKRSLNENVEKRFVSESFDPFKLSKQLNSNRPEQQSDSSSNQKNTTNPSNRDVIYDVIEDNFENSSHSLQEYKLEEIKTLETSVVDAKVNEGKIDQHNQQNTVKKRKLFNPKNLDYLNEFNL